MIVKVYTMILKVYHSTTWYISLYTCDYPIQQMEFMEIRAENLYSGSMKAPFGHIKWIASGSHYASPIPHIQRYTTRSVKHFVNFLLCKS